MTITRHLRKVKSWIGFNLKSRLIDKTVLEMSVHSNNIWFLLADFLVHKNEIGWNILVGS